MKSLPLPYYIYSIVFFVFLAGCREKSDEAGSNPQPDIPHSTDPSQPAPETLAMIDSVQKAQQRVDPMKVTAFMSIRRAAIYAQKMEASSGVEKANFMLLYGFEELKAGNSKKAMEIFRNVLTYVEPLQIPGKPQTVHEVKKLIALSALRLGEQDNCILNHTSASCVIPIAKPGQHQMTEGSEMAMTLYEEILRENPKDLTSRYLLNIAAMTLGKFPDGVPSSMRLPPGYFTSPVSFPAFTDIAPELGLDRRGLAGGIAVEDFDRDGDLDIMHSAWGFNDQIKLHRNNGDGSFEEVAMISGLKGVTGGLNLRHADYNNDGYADVLVLRGAWLQDQGSIPNSLLKNNGDGTFTDVAVSAGIYSKRPSQNAVWADFDLDGWLDLFIGNESIPESGPSFNFPAELYHNQRNGAFNEVSRLAGLNVNSFVKGSTSGDINNDGKEDLYVTSLNAYNSLYLNVSDESGIKFQNISSTSGTGEPLVAFPTWMFDFNNDGWLDIFVSAYSDGSDDLPAKVLAAYGKKDDPFRPRLYRNNRNNTFTEMSSEMGLIEPAYTMGCNYGDLDNDGFPDFYLGTGEPNLRSIVPNKMYWNRNGKSFADITYSGGFGNIQKGHGVGFADFDLDGDQDLYVVMGGSFEGDVYQNLFFENPIGNKNHWIVLRLEGTTANRLAIGARVEIEIVENGQRRSVHNVISTGASFGGNSLQLEAGLGKAEKIEKLTVKWPNKQLTIQQFENVAVDKAYTLKEGEQLQEIPYNTIPLKKKTHQEH